MNRNQLITSIRDQQSKRETRAKENRERIKRSIR